MKPSQKYDFSDLEILMNKLLVGQTNTSVLREIRNELNSFFRDSKCLDVILTDNKDKLFFGMSVIANIHDTDIENIITNDDPYRISEYYIEIDSKLLSPMLDITNRELVAMLLHEIGHVVNDSAPIEHVRQSIDLYLADNNEVLKLRDSVNYKEILIYGIKDTISRFTSMFEYNKDEVIADEFAASYGYNDDLQSAFNKIVKNGLLLNKDVDNKLIVLSWSLRLYKDVKTKRIPALKHLKKIQQLSGSKLEKREAEYLAKKLNRIDDSLLESNILKDKYLMIIRRNRRSNLRYFKDESYELAMRIKGCDDEDEAIYLMRSINTKLSIIDEYINHTSDMGESERKQWFEVDKIYKGLRETLTKKTVYRNHKFDIVVQYPDIIADRYK